MSPTPEEALNYPITERTRFRVRLDLSHSRVPLPVELKPGPVWLRHFTSFEACQRAWVAFRSLYDLGMSQCCGGEIFDEQGQHIAQVSYNGRLWPPGEWQPSKTHAAEAPTISEEDLRTIADITGQTLVAEH